MTKAEAKAIFRGLIGLTGLNNRTAGEILERSPQTIRHKMMDTSHHDITDRDLDILIDRWRRIESGDEGLTGPAADNAAALRYVRGRQTD